MGNVDEFPVAEHFYESLGCYVVSSPRVALIGLGLSRILNKPPFWFFAQLQPETHKSGKREKGSLSCRTKSREFESVCRMHQ